MFSLFKKTPSSDEMVERLVSALFECAYINSKVVDSGKKDCLKNLNIWIMNNHQVKAVFNEEPKSNNYMDFSLKSIREIKDGKLQNISEEDLIIKRPISLDGMDIITNSLFGSITHDIRRQVDASKVTEQLYKMATMVFIGAQLNDFY